MLRYFNLRNIYSTVSFLSMILSTGAVESEMYITAAVLIVICGITAYLALREDGTCRQKNRPRKPGSKEVY